MAQNGNPNERSYIMVKPDGVQRGLVGEIISRFEKRGFKIIALTMKQADEKILAKHYEEHGPSEENGPTGRKFYPGLIKYMSSGPVVGFVIQGTDAVKTGRAMLGATDPLKSSPGTIRGDYALVMGRNICHGSDSVENAEREIGLWFPEGAAKYELANQPWIYE